MMEKFSMVESYCAVLDVDHIDTDQIIPARFLKVTQKTGLGMFLFADWRNQADGQPDQGFVLNHIDTEQTCILIAGDNFGCGSSREHAPWALMDFGFKVVIAESFGDIFRNNSLKNGLLLVQLNSEHLDRIKKHLSQFALEKTKVELEAQIVSVGGLGEFEFPIDPFSKTCLLQGVDALGYLLAHEAQITQFELEYERHSFTTLMF